VALQWTDSGVSAAFLDWTNPRGIDALSFLRDYSAHRTDPIEAIRCAAQMIAKGYADVVIVDSSEGEKAYSPSEFAQFHSDPEKNSEAQEISNKLPASQKKADLPTKVGREAA
jgi:hypothetical protein